MRGRRIGGALRAAASLLLFLAAWEGLARLLHGTFLLAGPAGILRYGADHAAMLLRAAAVTGGAALRGFLWGNLAAVALAFAAVLLPRAERVATIVALVVFCLPLVATGPILRVIFGPGEGPQVTLAALAVYYPTFLCLLVGLRAVPASWLDLVASYGRGGVSQLLRVRVFAALPYLVAGLQIAAPAAVLGAMVGEFTGAERGLGVLTLRAMRGLDAEATWTVAALAAGLSLAAYALIGMAGRWLGAGPPPLILAPLRPAPGGRRFAGAATAVMVIAAIAALWLGLFQLFDLNSFFAKRPGDIFAFLFTAPEAAARRATLSAALAETLALALPGYLAGLAAGVAGAALIVLRPGLSRPVLRLAIALRSVPIVTTAPLIVLALGRGAAGTIAIVAVMIFFPTLVACAEGLRRMPGQVHDLFRSYAASPLRLLLWARLPAMLPALFASARMAIPAALLAATTAEWLATGRGMGRLMALSASLSDYGMLWSGIVLVALTASLAYLLTEAVERRVLARFAGEQLERR